MQTVNLRKLFIKPFIPSFFPFLAFFCVSAIISPFIVLQVKICFTEPAKSIIAIHYSAGFCIVFRGWFFRFVFHELVKSSFSKLSDRHLCHDIKSFQESPRAGLINAFSRLHEHYNAFSRSCQGVFGKIIAFSRSFFFVSDCTQFNTLSERSGPRAGRRGMERGARAAGKGPDHREK